MATFLSMLHIFAFVWVGRGNLHCLPAAIPKYNRCGQHTNAHPLLNSNDKVTPKGLIDIYGDNGIILYALITPGSMSTNSEQHLPHYYISAQNRHKFMLANATAVSAKQTSCHHS